MEHQSCKKLYPQASLQDQRLNSEACTIRNNTRSAITERLMVVNKGNTGRYGFQYNLKKGSEGARNLAGKAF